MDARTTDIWFGPGAKKGVFGAGVALGLQESMARGEIDSSQFRLYGSSIGCLNAVFLATGNTGCGLSIFQEETQKLVTASNLVPATGARIINRLTHVSRLTASSVRVPSVLNLEHIFDVMASRTPDIVNQLRESPIPIFAESVDRDGRFQYAELRSSAEPLQEIRHALNFVPFTGQQDADRLDSVIKGYGFSELLRGGQGPLIVVLNAKPTSRRASTLSDLVCAALSGDRRIARLYLRSRGHRRAACRDACEADRDVFLISPPQKAKLTDPSGFQAVHQSGQLAAQRIVRFLNTVNTDVHSPRTTARTL